jgi:hypothetical protein
VSSLSVICCSDHQYQPSFLFGTAGNIVAGARLEVEAVLDSNGVLQAGKVKFEDNDARLQAQENATYKPATWSEKQCF